MKRLVRSTVVALSVALLSAPVLAHGGDADAAAKALRASFDAISSIQDPAERKAAQEKFTAECTKFIEEFGATITDGPAYATLGLAYTLTGNREKGDEILDKYQEGLEGKKAPSLNVWHAIGAPNNWSLDQAKGKVVLVDFWATWCPPCRAVIPDLVKLYEKRSKDGLLVVGATQLYGSGFLGGKSVRDLDKEAELKLNADFQKEMNISYPIVFCEKNTGMVSYGVRGIPTLVLIDREGKVRHIQTGAGDHATLDAKIEELLKAGKTDHSGY